MNTGFRALRSNEGLTNAQKISLNTLYSGQFTFSTQLITVNYLVIISHQHSTTVSLETYPFYLLV